MRILIVKTSAIGDVLQTLPVLSYLKSRYPDAQIDWVVEASSASLLKAHPDLTRVIVVHSKKWRKAPFMHRREIAETLRSLRAVSYDLLFDLQGNSKSALLTFTARAKEKVGFAFSSLPEKTNWLVTNRRFTPSAHLSRPAYYLSLVQSAFNDSAPFTSVPLELRLTEQEQQRLDTLLPSTERPKFMVCFGSNWTNKQLEPSQLASFLAQVDAHYAPHFLFIYGNAVEKSQAEALHALFPHSQVVGEMSLAFWQRLMQRMDLLLTMDSAALHLCATTTTPSFSFFGPSSSALYKPEGEQHASFQGSCPYGRTFAVRCPVLRTCPTGACLKDAPMHELFAHFQRFCAFKYSVRKF